MTRARWCWCGNRSASFSSRGKQIFKELHRDSSKARNNRPGINSRAPSRGNPLKWVGVQTWSTWFWSGVAGDSDHRRSSEENGVTRGDVAVAVVGILGGFHFPPRGKSAFAFIRVHLRFFQAVKPGQFKRIFHLTNWSEKCKIAVVVRGHWLFAGKGMGGNNCKNNVLATPPSHT